MDSLCGSNNSQNWVTACCSQWMSSPLPHYHSILSVDLEGCDSCGQRCRSFLTTTPAAASLKRRVDSWASCSKKKSVIVLLMYPALEPYRPLVCSKGYFDIKFTLEMLSIMSFRAVRWLETATPSISASTSAFSSKPVSLLWPREPDL